MVFKRPLEVPAQSVPPARYGELVQFLNEVAGSAEWPVVLVQ